jgi:hypothetical protein
MSDLMLNHGLLAKPSPAVAGLARAFTLSTVRRLDGRRKGEVVRFLAGALLLEPPEPHGEPIVSLVGADLRGLDLSRAPVASATLAGADLRNARFDGAQLFDDDFSGANLAGASFRSAVVVDADFDHANLSAASFSSAEVAASTGRRVVLDSTCLSRASFADVSFHGVVSLRDAVGRGVSFRHAVGLKYLLTTDAALTDVEANDASELPKRWLQPGPDPLRTGAKGSVLCAAPPSGATTRSADA